MAGGVSGIGKVYIYVYTHTQNFWLAKYSRNKSSRIQRGGVGERGKLMNTMIMIAT